MSNLYFSEEELLKHRDHLSIQPTLSIGDETLAKEVYEAAQADDEKVRIEAARKLQNALRRVLTWVDGPVYSIYEAYSGVSLIILPFFMSGHRQYILDYKPGKPFKLGEIWWSYAPCFTPIHVDSIHALQIHVDDFYGLREAVLNIMKKRNAPRRSNVHDFFPDNPVLHRERLTMSKEEWKEAEKDLASLDEED